jgi:hypothetical protein
MKTMKNWVHAAFGALALLTICVFWSGTAITELFGDARSVAVAKNAVLMGMLVLIPSMAIAGASGFSLGRKWRSPVVTRKALRMKFVAANGLLILLPSAFFLAGRAGAGDFGPAFVAVQAVELVAGAVNISLLGLNMRDGLSLRRKAKAAVALA